MPVKSFRRRLFKIEQKVHKKQSYQVIINNQIQDDIDMKMTDEEKAFAEKYPDGKHLSFNTFSEMRDYYNQIKNELKSSLSLNFWYTVDIRLSDDKDAFLFVIYED